MDHADGALRSGSSWTDRARHGPALVRGGIPPERIILAFSSEGPYPYSEVLAA